MFYGTLGEGLGWFRGVYVMPRVWRDVIREVHFARVELGVVTGKVIGFECRE